MTTSKFKFQWVPNTKVVGKEDRPTNELDKKPGYIDQSSIEELTGYFKNSAKFIALKKTIESTEFKKSRKHKPQRYGQIPKLKRVPIRYLLTALAVQRKIDWDHLIKIITNWDSRRPATVNVINIPKTNQYYITDGQHTVMAIAVRAITGLFPDIDPEEWLDVEINCQVVETNDFSFAREHFLGINGEDKLKIDPFDIHKINVFGKRLDSPDKDTQEKYELANAIQTALESYGLIPVHPESNDRMKAGSVVHVNLLKKIDVADIKFFGENHKKYWDQEPLDAVEMLPFQDLRRRLIKEGADFADPEFKRFMTDINALVKEIAGGWAEFKNLTQQLYPDYYERAFGDTVMACPKDASLVLLSQLYLKAGGTYKYLPKSLYTRYCENNTCMFDVMPLAKRALFK